MKPRIRVQARSRQVAPVLVFQRQPSPLVASHIETISRMAAAGEVDGIAIAASRSDGGITTAYVTGSSLFRLIAAVIAVDQRLRREIET